MIFYPSLPQKAVTSPSLLMNRAQVNRVQLGYILLPMYWCIQLYSGHWGNRQKRHRGPCLKIDLAESRNDK
jgi:hypothetical protein